MWICGFVDCGFGVKVQNMMKLGSTEQWSHEDLRIWGFGVNVQIMMKLESTEQWSHLKKLIFDLSWPLPTLYDFVNIHDLKLHKNLSWMTLFPAKTEKVDFWPFLTFYWPWIIFYTCKLYMNENYMKNRVDWHPTQLNLIKLKIHPPTTFNIL